jgi:hypothetical protein
LYDRVMTLVFPSTDALRMALMGGIVPPSVSLAPARVGRDDQRIWIAPSASLGDAALATLQSLGVQLDGKRTGGSDFVHWLQALPLIRIAQPTEVHDQTPVLFELPAPALAEFVGEILRLGNDRQGYRILSTGAESAIGQTSRALLRVIGPPYFSLLRSLDWHEDGAPRAFIERAPGVWIEHGWSHPMETRLRAPSGQFVLIEAPDDWRYIRSAPFRDIYDALDVRLEPDSIAWGAAPPDSIDVPLRLASGNATEAPELWVLPVDGEEQIDRLVQSADSRLLGRLTFAIGEGPNRTTAIVRNRPGKHSPPELRFEGALTCRPFLRVPNLYLPCGSSLQPPISREMARQLLADDSERTTWLVPTEDGSFTAQSLPESAFRPLGDWVEHVLDRDRASLTEWAAASHCEFSAYVTSESSILLTPLSGTQSKSPAKPVPTPAPTPKPATRTPPPRSRTPRPIPPPASATPLPRPQPSDLQAQLRSAEEIFLSGGGELDAPARQALWPELGRLNAALGQTAEAALSWLHVLWTERRPAEGIAWNWVTSERALARRELTEHDLSRLMAPATPTGADMRALAAAILWATRQNPLPPILVERLPAVQSYLERHERLLPVRAVWLAWHGMIQHVGGDPLTLARVRDRLLDRLLTEGLSAERDLPAFLRFSGQGGGDRLRTVRDRMERLRHLMHEWSGFAADGLQQTPAYIDLMFAFAAARMGEGGATRRLLETASASLDASGSDAHRFLLEAFRWRIEQVLAGKAHAGPLPAEQIEYLEQMRRDERALPATDDLQRRGTYAIDRLRETSQILDPQEQLDPYRHTKQESDPLIRELARLADVHEPRALRDGLRRLLVEARSRPQPEVRFRILADCLPLSARLGAQACGDLLDRVVGAVADAPRSKDPVLQTQQALLLERSLFFAAHFDRTELIGDFIARLEELLGEPASISAAEARSRLIGQSLRSLRKCGLRDRTERLLALVAEAADRTAMSSTRSDRMQMELTRTRLHAASGWLSTDQAEQAWPILDEARDLIFSGRGVHAGEHALYVSLICTYISALAYAPLDEALARVEELFVRDGMARLPNTFTTAPYYSRFHLNVVEAVVQALASEEFALGPAARRWLDDDEYLVRRRIHRDVRAAMGE